MKLLVVSFALAVLPMWGAHQETMLPPITLYTHFQQDPPALVVEAMRTEVQTIMAPMGLKFQWMDLAASDGRQVSVELAVVEFKGRCDVDNLLTHDSNPGPLGWTHISEGVILPFANVDCSAVRSFIPRELRDTRADDRDSAFGRALGRILAHELYHIFANTTRHGSEGVGREFYSARDLLSSNFQFQARESMALLNGKAHAALANAQAADIDDSEHRN